MGLRALLLDFGGTLATEDPPRAAIYAQAADARGRLCTPDQMAELMGRTHRALPVEVDGGWRYTDPWFRAFIEQIFHVELGLERSTLPGLEEELFERFSDAATFRVFPGARELLESARRGGLALALVSNWSPRLALLTRRLGLASWFDAVVCSAEERVEKPDPGLFRRALERLAVPPDAALHAGDRRQEDVDGARAAGLTAILVDHSGARPEESGRVTSLFELSDHVARLLA